MGDPHDLGSENVTITTMYARKDLTVRPVSHAVPVPHTVPVSHRVPVPSRKAPGLLLFPLILAVLASHTAQMRL